MNRDHETATAVLQRFGVDPDVRTIAAVVDAISEERAACAALADELLGACSITGRRILWRGGLPFGLQGDHFGPTDAPGT